jgi:arabinofuranosyltransferase
VRLASVAPLIVPLVVLGWAGWLRRWFSEDAFITLRSVDNLLAGHGPVFNVGERVESSTSALWQFMLAACGPLRGILPLEWWAVLLGLVLTLVGLALAQRGALLLTPSPKARLVLPLGALVVAALPPFWDFATSGLETGLGFAWIGACYWGLTRYHAAGEVSAQPQGGNDHTDHAPRWLAVLVGLGPLIRPDFGVFSVGFMVLLLVVARGQRKTSMFRTLAWVALLPLAYELCRASFYATLTPTPALAKEATKANWEQGRLYALDLVRPYVLWFPLVIAVGALFVRIMQERQLGKPGVIPLLAGPPLFGVLHSTFVLAVGGDFMHGRLLLPGLFAILLPVSAVACSRLSVPAVVAMAAWAGVSVAVMRVPYEGLGRDGIADERAFYVAASARAHPVTIEDYSRNALVRDGLRIGQAARGPRRFVELAIPGDYVTIPVAPTVSAPVAVSRHNVGMLAYAAGPRAYVGDELGLGDPLAARLRLPARRARPGHEKYLPPVWYAARLVPVEGPVPSLVASPEELGAARRALACAPLRDLMSAVRSPFSLGQALENLNQAWRLTNLRFPADPFEAERELC